MGLVCGPYNQLSGWRQDFLFVCLAFFYGGGSGGSVRCELDFSFPGQCQKLSFITNSHLLSLAPMNAPAEVFDIRFGGEVIGWFRLVFANKQHCRTRSLMNNF